MEKDKFVICRTFFCPVCFSKNLPHDESIFVVYGTDCQSFLVKKANHRPKIGYTPHIIMYDDVSTDTHKELLVCCGLNHCGVLLHQSNDPEYPYDIELRKVRIYKMIHQEVDALIKFKDNTYYLD